MRVLFAVDGSDGSFAAIEQVAPLLRDPQDEVALYCHPPQVRVNSKNHLDELLNSTEATFAELIFSKARTRLGPELADKAHTIVGHQDARRGLIVAAQQWSADLIVVGARGLNAFQRLLLGSVSRAVVHASHIPVWVARPRKNDPGRGWRVLLSSESPATAKRPAQLLGKFFWPHDTLFNVLTVNVSVFAGRVPDWLQQQARSPDVDAMVQKWAREHDAELRDNVAKMKAFVEDLPAPLSKAEPMVIEGEPTTSILAAASGNDCDLIVVGSHQKRSIDSMILGSVSETVLNHADCSVLIVPHQQAP